MRKSVTVYNYLGVPEILPPSTHQMSHIDILDVAIDKLWSPEIRALMQPVGHPNSHRFLFQQLQAVQLIQAEAAKQGMGLIETCDPWKLMKSLRRVAARRGISPQQLRIPMQQAAE